MWLDCGYVTDEMTVGVKETLSIDGADRFIENDTAGRRVIPNLLMVHNPVKEMIENFTQTADPDLTSGEELGPEEFPV